jgi:hypothetical protein
MSDPAPGDVPRPGEPASADALAGGSPFDTDLSAGEGPGASDTAAALGASGVRVEYTDSMAEGVYVVYRGGPPRLLVNEAWWRRARPVERIQALETLWARLQSIPPESWDSLEHP